LLTTHYAISYNEIFLNNKNARDFQDTPCPPTHREEANNPSSQPKYCGTPPALQATVPGDCPYPHPAPLATFPWKQLLVGLGCPVFATLPLKQTPSEVGSISPKLRQLGF
jgi:hypothetical protein